MTTEQFTYWLQGFAELHPEPPTAEQWQAIRDHLALVFEKRTSDYFPPAAPVGPLPYYPPQPGAPRYVPPPTVTC